jgi:hypothetical protein
MIKTAASPSRGRHNQIQGKIANTRLETLSRLLVLESLTTAIAPPSGT